MMDQSCRLYQYLSAATALLSVVAGGMHYAWPSPSIPQFIYEKSTSFHISSEEGSWIIIMEMIIQIPASFMAVVLNNRFGRKKSILLSAFPYSAAWIMIIFARSSVELFIARLFVGISDGIAFTVIPIYIGEIADPNIRGLLGASISTSWIFGMLLINILGSFLSVTITAAISLVVPLLFILTFVWMPESPYYLIIKKDIDKARWSLQKLKGKSDVEDELLRLKTAVEKQTQEKGSFLELFTKKNNQKSLGIMTVIRNTQQMSGVAAISFYTFTIFSSSGDFISPVTATILYVTMQFIMTSVCSIVIDRTGRRPLLIASVLGSGICLFIEGCYFYIEDFTDLEIKSLNFIPVVALIGYVIIFNLGAQPIALLMQGELFPTNVKSLAGCVSEVYFCILASLFSKFFQIMRDSWGMFVPFFCFAACCGVNLIFVILFLPETKGKTLEEIQEDLMCKKSKKEVNVVV